MWAFVADPKVLTVLLASFGGAVAWLWGKAAVARQKRQEIIDNLQRRVSECETDRALLRREVAEMQGSITTLTKLLKKEAKLG